MEEKNTILPKIDYYVKLILKKRWYIIIPFCLFMLVGIYFSVTLPKIYKASTLIIVEPKSIPDKYVPSLQTQDTHEQILTIEQQIKSRSNIERLIEKFKLFTGQESANMFPEDKIAFIIKKIKLSVTKSRGGVESFQIEYEDKEPEKVKDIVNWLSTTFINESIKLRELQIHDTNQFLTGELTLLVNRLKDIEQSIKEYRKQHYGELPEELSSNLAALQRLQEQLNEKQQNIRDAKNRLILIENQITMAQYNLTANLIMPEESKTDKSPDNSLDSEIDRIQNTLKQLRTKYTDRHPDIVRLNDMLLSAKAKQASSVSDEDLKIEEDMLPSSEEDKNDGEGETSLTGNGIMQSPFYYELMMQRDDIKNEIKGYSEGLKGIEEDLVKYEKRIEMTSRVEQEIIDLNRNYINLQRTYNNLLDKKLESDIAVNLEKKQKGQKFRVVDTAKLPQKPVAPDITVIFAACVIGGMGIGLVVIFLFDFIDNTFKIPEDIAGKLDVPLLSTIPELKGRNHFIIHKCNQVLTGLSLIVAFALFSIFGLLVLKGTDRAMELLKKTI